MKILYHHYKAIDIKLHSKQTAVRIEKNMKSFSKLKTTKYRNEKWKIQIIKHGKHSFKFKHLNKEKYLKKKLIEF